MSGPADKPDRFKPADPVIPGVPQRPPEKKEEKKLPPSGPPPAWQSPTVMAGAGIGALVLLAGASLAWHVMKPAPPPAPVVLTTTDPAAGTAGSSMAEPAAPQLPEAPGPVATVEEMAKPWSVVRFKFHRATGELLNGMVIRLPSAPGYWGLLSVAPYGRCELVLETDLAKIRSEYKFAAAHPMVVDSCTQVVYDPLTLGSATGLWIRGRVAGGPGIRPPYEVEIKVEQGYVVASRSE
jgi:hypothetical protein